MEEEMRRFLAAHTGVSETKIHAGSRLLQDLGMDGDDAIAFFEEYQKRFEVDITPLEAAWDDYFGPEVSSPDFFVFAGLCPFALAAVFPLAARFHAPGWLTTLAAVMFAFITQMAWRRASYWPLGLYVSSMRWRSPKAITFTELVSAAHTGQWRRPEASV